MTTLIELPANAHYDLVHGRPAPIERDNDGSVIIRLNITPEAGAGKDGQPATQTGWACYEVRSWQGATKAALKKAVIRSLIDETAEFATLNDYNAHVLGINADDTAVERYKQHLRLVAAIDEAITQALEL